MTTKLKAPCITWGFFIGAVALDWFSRDVMVENKKFAHMKKPRWLHRGFVFQRCCGDYAAWWRHLPS